MLASDAVDELTPATIQIASAQNKKLCAQIPFALLPYSFYGIPAKEYRYSRVEALRRYVTCCFQPARRFGFKGYVPRYGTSKDCVCASYHDSVMLPSLA